MCVYSNLAGAINEVHSRPVPISVCVPGEEFVVQSDGILEPVRLHGTLDVLDGDCSNANSGLWTPTTVKSGWYRSCIRRRKGRVRWQFTHANVQKSSRTTRSRRAASISGSPSGVFNHGSMPTSSGARPRTGNRRAASSTGPRGVSCREGHNWVHGVGRMRSRRSRRVITESHVPIAIATRVGPGQQDKAIER